MYPRKLFNIILKIFGLFFLREILNAIPQVISPIVQFFAISEIGPIIATFIVSLLILAFYTFLVFQLLFKTNKIIDALKLDQGFAEMDLSIEEKEKVPVDLSSKSIYITALIVIGGVILIDEIPNLCRQVYLYVDQANFRFASAKPDFSYIIFSIAKILIALLIIGERIRIIEFLENRNISKYQDEE